MIELPAQSAHNDVSEAVLLLGDEMKRLIVLAAIAAVATSVLAEDAVTQHTVCANAAALNENFLSLAKLGQNPSEVALAEIDDSTPPQVTLVVLSMSKDTWKNRYLYTSEIANNVGYAICMKIHAED